jgi:hypothetical protein
MRIGVSARNLPRGQGHKVLATGRQALIQICDSHLNPGHEGFRIVPTLELA